MKETVYSDFVDKLRAESDIVSVISDYVHLQKRGKDYWGCCPFHQEKTPSFSVNPDKGFFYCFGCQTGGNVFTFLMKIENLDFFDAVKLLAKKLNVPLPAREKNDQEKYFDKLYKLNDLAKDFFLSCLTKTNQAVAARDYLNSRGISLAMIEKFSIGYAPAAWDKLSGALLRRGFDEELLIKAGLSLRRSSGGLYDRFRNRIMFPIRDARGRIVGFGGRVLDDSQPKYLNTPETMLFNKRKVLYGFDQALEVIRATGRVVVVEGYMDTVTAHSAGFSNVVASLGTAFSVEQAKQLVRYAKEILFAYDSDAAGQNATIRALSTVNALGVGVKVVHIPEGKDPDEYIRRFGADAFKALVDEADNLVDYQIKQAFATVEHSSLEGKVELVGKVVPVLASINNAVEANIYVAQVAQKLNIEESAIRTEIAKFLRNTQKDKNVNYGKYISVESVSKKKANSANMLAEQHLIRLMIDDCSLIPYIMTQISLEEISDAQHKEIINLIFNEYNNEKAIQDINWILSLSDAANNVLSRIMVQDFDGGGDIVKIVDDCIKTVRLYHLSFLYEQHRLEADKLQRMGDSGFLQELAESQRIKYEIDKIHHSHK